MEKAWHDVLLHGFARLARKPNRSIHFASTYAYQPTDCSQHHHGSYWWTVHVSIPERATYGYLTAAATPYHGRHRSHRYGTSLDNYILGVRTSSQYPKNY